MQAKLRYSTLLAFLILTCLLYLLAKHASAPQHRKARRSYLGRSSDEGQSGLLSGPLGFRNNVLVASPPARPLNSTLCTMASCFDFSLCSGRPFRLYVYPLEDAVPPSSSYMKILAALRESRYYTSDPSLACLFVLALDTLDRDPLSQDFVRNMPARLDRLATWRGGQNHLVFNLYSGTWPDYAEDLSFDIGRAILAKASMSVENYRPGFDISLPLFHRHHPGRGGAPGLATSNLFPVTSKHFLAFKGKRYVHGIGSDTRNSLHHLHNGREVVMVTTCKHGKNWREMMDERCEEDNAEYDRWDYEQLLSNSTFCLVPRGRRLGSFRFLETLQAGCLPVILSNGWQLPLAGVVDWSQAAVIIDERQLMQVPEILHGLSKPQIYAMRRQTQVLWERHLSSVQKIVDTTVEIVRGRVKPHLAQPCHQWNSHPGRALAILPSLPLPAIANTSALPPIQMTKASPTSFSSFTAIITASANLTITSSSPIFRLIKAVAGSTNVESIVVLWGGTLKPPPLKDWARLGGFPASTPLKILPPTSPVSNISKRFQAVSDAPTEAVLCLDDDSILTTSEVDFAFEVWKEFTDRIVGFPARSHYWDDSKHRWVYSSKLSNSYSMVLTSAAFISRRLASLFLSKLPPAVLASLQPPCEHILVNFLAAHLTKLPPVKVSGRRKTREGISSQEEWSSLQTCVNQFAGAFGYMPLVDSLLRLDPVLFKDPVSNLRKKYKALEGAP